MRNSYKILFPPIELKLLLSIRIILKMPPLL